MTDTAIAYFLYAFGILFREGLETILVIVALAASLRQSGMERRVRDVYAGAALAIAISVLLAIAINRIFSDNFSDALEGAFQIGGAVMLLIVAAWLNSRANVLRWQHYLADRVGAANVSLVPGIALGATAFIAVLREGAETIVFFQGLLAGATAGIETHAVAAGVAASVAVLIGAFVILERRAVKLPLKMFFTLTSVLLCLMALIFVGQGIASLQEAEVVRATFLDHIPTIKMLGIFPTLESLLAQLIFAAVIVGTTLMTRRRGSLMHFSPALRKAH